MLNCKVIELHHEKDAYIAWLDKCPFALFFHHYEYLSLLENHLSCKAYFIVCYDDLEQWQGILPILVKSTEIGTAINSMAYFGSNGSFLLIDENREEVKQALLKALENYSEQIDALSWNIVSNYYLPQHVDLIKVNTELNNISERIGQVTTLPDYNEGIEKDLLSLFDDPRPRNIRKAQKSGVQVILSNGSEDDWKFLHRIHSENMGAIGAPVKQLSFFTSIPKYISSQFYSLYIAKVGDEKVAAMLVFQYNDTVEYYTPGTDVKYRNLQPSSLLIFQAMKDLAAKGYKYWNWGGTASREAGVYDFKKKWGAQEKLYYHLTKIKNNKLLNYTSQQLMDNFYGFFVVPFNQLKK